MNHFLKKLKKILLSDGALVIVLLLYTITSIIPISNAEEFQKLEKVESTMQNQSREIKKLQNNLSDLEKELDITKQELEEIIKKLEEAKYYMPNVQLSKDLQKYMYDTCKKYNVDYIEAHAVMKVENPSYNPRLVHKNKNGTVDVGLFQINEVNHQTLKEKLGVVDFKDPYQNIKAGIYFLSKLNKYEGHKKFMAYNFGEYGMKKAIRKGYLSSAYSRKVMKYVEDLKGNY